MKRSLLLFVSLFLGIAAFAGKPKFGPGIFPGINEGEGNTTGNNSCGTEVTLPIGLPVAGDEAVAGSEASTTSNIVYTFDLSPDEGAASINQTHSALERAKNMNAACVLIRIDGFAGGWDVAENIRQEIISYDRPVMVYVNNQTIPAANFISMGADSIYTKKGSTISSKKAAGNKNVVVNTKTKSEKIAALVPYPKTAANPDELYCNDATMNQILYKAGLSNLKVVEHQAGFSERAIDVLMHPLIVMTVLLLIGFIMRKTAKGKLPGPLMYLLAFSVLLYLAPFQLSGLANSGEILASLALIVAVIVSARYNKRWLTGIFLVGLTFMFSLVRAGDTHAILQYGTFSELLTLPSIPLGLVILGWWLGKIGESRKVNELPTGETAQPAFATAA